MTRMELASQARTMRGGRSGPSVANASTVVTTAANTVAAAPDVALIHPGVMKYFKEIGVAKK